MTKLKQTSHKGGLCRNLLLSLLLLALCCASTPNPLLAQNEPAAQEEAADTTQAEEPELLSTRLSLYVTQLPGDSIELQALLRAKIEGTWQKVEAAEIEFFSVADETETSLGKLTTNAGGTATKVIGAGKFPLNADGLLGFAARFAGNDQLEESDGDASIRRAKMMLVAEQGDNFHLIKVKVTAPAKQGEEPIAEAEVAVYVKRLFSALKIGEGTTDENGEAEIEFPADLAGDDQGNLYIMARIEDFEEYGNLAASTVQPWGKSVSYKVEALPRALWSTNPPLWMVFTFFVLMAAVWGHYAVIVYLINRIKKAGKTG